MPRTENILLGILSSAIFLLFIEIINYVIDKKKYGFIEGVFYRKAIYQVNDNRLRGFEIPTDIADNEQKRKKRMELSKDKGERYSDDSIYHELVYQRCAEIKYSIRLNYKFQGMYSGTAEYFLHDTYTGRWQDRNIGKTKAAITLNMNLANKNTGEGSYKYVNKEDFGKYEFQIDDENPNRIIVYYRNTLPSGLSEGYEIWEKA
ncbi:MAG: hypothetical protein FGM46_10130 [Ferruginibacter sp.]|nr:hypothetical protein [Ferruginibacter sp.]